MMLCSIFGEKIITPASNSEKRRGGGVIYYESMNYEVDGWRAIQL